MDMLRLVKIVLIVLVALWGLFGGIGNLVGYEGGHAQVSAIMLREGAIPGGGPFVAMSHPLMTHLGYSVIWIGKLGSGLLCLWGAAGMWRARSTPGAVFNTAKATALSGCGIALVMLFGGFFVAGGAYFAMWSSTVGQSSHLFAAQFIVGIGTVALFVGMADE
jgi:predicted small integral membrane protein